MIESFSMSSKRRAGDFGPFKPYIVISFIDSNLLILEMINLVIVINNSVHKRVSPFVCVWFRSYARDSVCTCVLPFVRA